MENIESLSKELHEAISERKKLEKIVKEVHDKVNFDGGLVYRCNLEDYEVRNTIEHNKILKEVKSDIKKISTKLDEIYPRVKEEMEVADAYKIIGNTWEGRIKNAGFWIKVFIGIGVIVGIVTTIFREIKAIIK